MCRIPQHRRGIPEYAFNRPVRHILDGIKQSFTTIARSVSERGLYRRRWVAVGGRKLRIANLTQPSMQVL